MLRLKDLELIFFTNNAIQTSCFVESLLTRHIFNFNPWETKVDHHRVISLKLKAPGQSNIRRNIGALVRGSMMMIFGLVLDDNLSLAHRIIFSFIDRGALVQRA